MKLPIFICIFLYSFAISSFSQNISKDEWLSQYSNTLAKYNADSISEEVYLQTIDSLTERLTVSGLSFTRDEMINLLSTYQMIAWNNPKKFQKFKAHYYRFLMNNALAGSRSGEVLFYAEKNEIESLKLGKKTLLIPYIELIIWAKSGNNDKVIELYENQKEYLSELLNDDTPDDNEFSAYLHALQFYYYVMRPMLQENNALADEVRNHSEILENKIEKQYYIPFPDYQDRVNPSIPKLLSIFTNIEYFAHHKNLEMQKKMLDSASVVFSNPTLKNDPYWKPYNNILNSLFVRYYLDVKDNKMAELYINRLVSSIKIFDDEMSTLYKFRAELKLNQGLYKDAYTLIDSALNFKTKELSTAYSEMTHLLYAHIESEHNKIELQQNDIIRRKQNIWIATISAIALGILLSAIYLMNRFNKNAKQQIKTLNKMTDLAIEEARILAIQDEQKKLGQNLHDDYSGSLISILHHLDFIKQKIHPNDEITQDLNLLRENVDNVYQSIRRKSHQIYKQTSEEYNNTFQESIKDIIDAVLPKKFYTTNIDIDHSSSESLNVQQRIELLRILQEATVNILKHSKATEINIFLFSAEKEIIFQISDNGIGIHDNILARKGIGIESIENRAKNMGGYVEFLNDEGTTLIIHIPNTFM